MEIPSNAGINSQPSASLSPRLSTATSFARTTVQGSATDPRRASMKPMSGSSNRHADAYLSELLSYSLERLRKEPELLREEKDQIERNIQSTSVSNYRAFIETANCLNTINQELGHVCGHLDLLLQGIPELASTCETFSSQSTEVMEQHTQNKQLASGQAALLELLEVPQLMDTCVRNGIYDEALDLQAFISRLGLLHPDVPVVRMLMQQVADVGQTMLQQLLSRLKSNIQLPECLRIMGYLRRIAAFSEAELRLQFLQCRDDWISQLVDELDETDSYEYLKHLTDVHRLHLFDAVMQYRAIFFDAPASSTAQDLSGAASSLALAAAPAVNIRETTVLYSWVQHRVGLYIEGLKQHLPNITEGSNLASVLEHCMYCGTSLSRVGLDFQALLQPIFESWVLQLFAQFMGSAVEAFNTRLESHKWVPMPASMLQKARHESSRSLVHVGSSKSVAAAGEGPEGRGQGGQEPGEAAAAAEGGQEAGTTAAVQPEDFSPNYVIMEHFPLAVFTNAVLSALNELRHCALLSLCKPASGLLQRSLEHVAATLMHYRHTHSLGDSEAALFKSATKAMLDVVIPYLAACFGRIFPGGATKLDTVSSAVILRQILTEF
eukprot:CAMPEP_0202892148 /NCGR_PEP_ID=MMETSP1392-20130828/1949_1 /ASSEMBLY_ACC=CAM_ASM_000868 /TAXON_ID=225041 /ORGANISM="Chlamydomonas chlamydogama, Strain SAG 11-48b" /LENGTH=607 /DNA_ID=CAMNT_0049576031 /DNA_START=154 /DNA_END=1977 /DNA_ORIENTATION=+